MRYRTFALTWYCCWAAAIATAALTTSGTFVGGRQPAAAGNSAGDQTKILQGWIDAACKLDGLHGPAGGTLRIPPGEYHVSDTLTVRNVSGLRVEGDGWATRVVYEGPAGRPAVELVNCADCRVSRLAVLAATKGVTSGVRLTNRGPNDPPATWTSGGNDFDHVFVGAMPGGGGSFQVAYDLDSLARGGPDANNDFPTFTRCTAANYTYAGWRINGSNLHGTRLVGCNALGAGQGQAGVACDYGNYVSVTGGYFNGHTFADVWGRNFQECIDVRYLRSEDSARLLVVEGPNAVMPVTVTGVMWDGKPPDFDDQVADRTRAVVDVRCAGPLILHGTVRTRTQNNPYVRLWGGDVGTSADVRLHLAAKQAGEGGPPGLPFTRRAFDFYPGSVDYGILHQQPDGSVTLTPRPAGQKRGR